MRNRKLLAVAALGAVLIVSVIGVGVAAGQPQPTAGQPGPNDRFITALAHRLNISEDQLRQAIRDARQDVGAPAGGPGPRRGGPHGPFFRASAQAISQLLNIPIDQLQDRLAGHTLAEVAAQATPPKTSQDIVNAIVSVANQRIDQMASARNLPPNRVAALKQRVNERAQQFVTTHRFPARGSGSRS
jgi:hypothetical protein